MWKWCVFLKNKQTRGTHIFRTRNSSTLLTFSRSLCVYQRKYHSDGYIFLWSIKDMANNKRCWKLARCSEYYLIYMAVIPKHLKIQISNYFLKLIVDILLYLIHCRLLTVWMIWQHVADEEILIKCTNVVAKYAVKSSCMGLNLFTVTRNN